MDALAWAGALALADKPISQLTYPDSKRVALARALAQEPELLLLDEPTSALDVSVQAQILRLLMRLRKELGMALMLITHDFGVIAGMVERVYVMHRGDIVEHGQVDTLFADRAAWAERALRNIAGMGPFSSDRTIAEYVDRVWSVKSLN